MRTCTIHSDTVIYPYVKYCKYPFTLQIMTLSFCSFLNGFRVERRREGDLIMLLSMNCIFYSIQIYPEIDIKMHARTQEKSHNRPHKIAAVCSKGRCKKACARIANCKSIEIFFLKKLYSFSELNLTDLVSNLK